MCFIDLIPKGYNCIKVIDDTSYMGYSVTFCPYSRMIDLDDGETINYCTFLEEELFDFVKNCNIGLINK